MATGKETRCTTIPTLRYRDAKAALGYLCDVFGFQRHAVHEGEGGAVMHAELSLGNGMIMLGSATETEFGRNIVQPEEAGGKETQSPYLVVADTDAIYVRAKAAGFEIVIDIKDEDYGGRGFTCRDLEGRLWTFGTYDPWE